jgi:hypothetical protein
MKTKPQIISAFIFAVMLFMAANLFAQRTSSVPVMMQKQSPIENVKTPNDTLLPGNLPDVTFPEYVMLTSDNGGYILGTNGWHDKCKCEEFKVTYNYHIEGAIYWFGYKRADSAGLVKFSIWDMDGTTGTISDTNNQPCPGTLFLSKIDTTTRIDTASTLNQAYIVMFPFPVLVNSDYCIGFDMSEINGDSIALVSTKKGQGGNLERVWEQWDVNDRWYTLQGAQWDSGTVDVDAMILPIIDNTAGCVENGNFISGMKLSQSYPNPTREACTISYEFLTPPASAAIEIMDMNGRRVYYENNIPIGQGINHKTIDVSGLKNGEYIYLLSTPDSRMAKRMTISR